MNKNMTKALEVCSTNGREHMILDGDTIIANIEGPFDDPLIQYVNLTDKKVVVMTFAPFNADEGTFWNVAEFLLEVNLSIDIGSFFVQKDGGLIGFCSGIYIGDKALDRDELGYHMNIGIYAFSRYGREIENRALTEIKTNSTQGELMYR